MFAGKMVISDDDNIEIAKQKLGEVHGEGRLIAEVDENGILKILIHDNITYLERSPTQSAIKEV